MSLYYCSDNNLQGVGLWMVSCTTPGAIVSCSISSLPLFIPTLSSLWWFKRVKLFPRSVSFGLLVQDYSTTISSRSGGSGHDVSNIYWLASSSRRKWNSLSDVRYSCLHLAMKCSNSNNSILTCSALLFVRVVIWWAFQPCRMCATVESSESEVTHVMAKNCRSGSSEVPKI